MKFISATVENLSLQSQVNDGAGGGTMAQNAIGRIPSTAHYQRPGKLSLANLLGNGISYELPSEVCQDSSMGHSIGVPIDRNSRKIKKDCVPQAPKRRRQRNTGNPKRIADRQARGQSLEEYKNARKNLPRKATIFLIQVLKRIQKDCNCKNDCECKIDSEKLKKIRDRPVCLNFCLIKLQKILTPEAFNKLMQEYYNHLESEIKREQGILDRLGPGKSDKVSRCIIKNFYLARQAADLLREGKWLESLKKFFGTGRRKNPLKQNMIFFLEEVGAIIEGSIPSSTKEEQDAINLIELEQKIAEIQPFKLLERNEFPAVEQIEEEQSEDQIYGVLSLNSFKSSSMEYE